MSDERWNHGRGEPYFFLSYAHTPKNDALDSDPNVWVKKLYDGLCEHILQLTDLPTGAKAGFLDQGMVVGTRWTDELSDNLARCKVFVPLYSPRYFISEQCGREWWAFSQREINQRARGDDSRESAIVPALWVPVEPAQMPQVARDLQFNHADLGVDYADEGFYGLTKLRYLRDEYERAVYRLAQRIVRAAHSVKLDSGQSYSAYESLPSAFGSPGHPREFDVLVLACTRSDRPPGSKPDYYGEFPLDWNPYHPESTRPLGEHAADLIRAIDYRVNVSDLESNVERILGTKSPRAPVLLIVDPWVLGNPRHREMLSQLDQVAPPWMTVVIPSNRQHPTNLVPEAPRPAEFEAVMPRLLRLGRSASRTSVSGIPTLEAFGVELGRIVRRSSFEFAAHQSAFPTGTPPPPRPRLRGPDSFS
ncbi:TIR-like protein FxsC [Streptomyces sp. NPDC058642]|uniref:TIR-like protein FxsC n=1 Tax=Streptomyces sp. NPDC058642 TaxID=3346572 RepID=UPI00364E2552